MNIISENVASMNSGNFNKSIKSIHSSEVKSARRALVAVNKHYLPSNNQKLQPHKNNQSIKKKDISVPESTNQNLIAIKPIGQLPDGTFEEIEFMDLPRDYQIDDFSDIWSVTDQPVAYLREFTNVMPFKRVNTGRPVYSSDPIFISDFKEVEVEPASVESRKFSFEDFLDDLTMLPPITDIPDIFFD